MTLLRDLASLLGAFLLVCLAFFTAAGATAFALEWGGWVLGSITFLVGLAVLLALYVRFAE